MDITKVAGLGTTIELCGRKFEIVPNKVQEIAEFTRFLHDKLGNPIEKVMQALQSPAGREQDRWALEAINDWKTELLAAETEKRQPNKALAIEAQLAEEWRAERKRMMLQAYEDAYGPKPPMDAPMFRPILTSSEGIAYELWLSIRHKHGEEFPTHQHLQVFMAEAISDQLRATAELAKLNDPDPAKNS